MRDYGKVHTSFWTSSTIRELSDDARLLATYLITCPHGTLAGVFRLPDGYVCDDINWPSERVSKGFDELISKGFAKRCETTKWVWVLKHFCWNPLENPNQRKSALKICGQIPSDCSWKLEFIRDCGALFDYVQPAKANPSATLPEGLSNQYQYQEQEQEQEQEQDGLPATAKPPRKPKSTQRPDDWKPNDQHKAFADKAGLSIIIEVEKFCDYHDANGSKKSCWDAAFRTWLRNAEQFKSERSPANNRAPKLSVAEQSKAAIDEFFKTNPEPIIGECAHVR